MSIKVINVVVAGATGYVGLDLVNLLSRHPFVKINYLCAKRNIGKKINFFDRRIKKKLPKISNIKKVDWKKIDLLFLSLPNGEAQKIIKKLYFKFNNLKFIDLSADFRLKNTSIYKRNYKKNHNAKNLISKSIYSISELKSKEIRNYRIISNPGCYPTSIQIPLIPLIKKNLISTKNIIIDSKSGYSGAGKNYKKKFNYKNFNSSTYAYSVNYHRHIAEIDQELKKFKTDINFTFNPHLIPTFRGILSSIYINKKKNTSPEIITRALQSFYKNERFVKILKSNSPLGTGNVINTNNCEISVCSTLDKNKVIILSAIDNLIKGAAGQAIQNMNLAFNYNQKVGLSWDYY